VTTAFGVSSFTFSLRSFIVHTSSCTSCFQRTILERIRRHLPLFHLRHSPKSPIETAASAACDNLFLHGRGLRFTLSLLQSTNRQHKIYGTYSKCNSALSDPRLCFSALCAFFNVWSRLLQVHSSSLGELMVLRLLLSAGEILTQCSPLAISQSSELSFVSRKSSNTNTLTPSPGFLDI
jgi:hypothetical protein